jgi:hypothetical protein
LLGIGHFCILVFGLELNISGASVCNFFLMLFSEKESWAGMKVRVPVSKEIEVNFTCF